MPSTSAKQAHFMAAVAHNPSFAKKVGVPQSVGREFNQADEAKKAHVQHPVRIDQARRVAKSMTQKRIKM